MSVREWGRKECEKKELERESKSDHFYEIERKNMCVRERNENVCVLES